MSNLKSNSFILNGSAVAVTSGILSVGGVNVVHANQTGNFTTSSQTGSFVTTSQTGSFVTIVQTGAFADSSKTGIFISTGQTGAFADSSKTGIFISTGQTGAFADSSKTGIFISTGQTGQFYPNGQNPSGYILPSQTGQFYPNGQNPSGYIMSTQTGVYADSAANLGTGSGWFSSKVNGQLQFKSLQAGTGIILTGGANIVSVNTFLGNQLLTGMQNNTVMTTGSLYYNLVSGTVGPGTWLTVAQTTFMVIGNNPTGVKIQAQLWNGSTGAGIYSAAQTSINTSGQAASGFAPMDLTAIINLTGATTTMTLRAVSTLPNTWALSSPVDLGTGVLSGVGTYLNMVRLT